MGGADQFFLLGLSHRGELFTSFKDEREETVIADGANASDRLGEGEIDSFLNHLWFVKRLVPGMVGAFAVSPGAFTDGFNYHGTHIFGLANPQ